MEQKDQTTQQPPAEAPTKVKMVKIRAKSPIRVNGKMLQPNETTLVPEDEAAGYIKPIQGAYAFYGTRYEGDQIPRAQYVRAELA